MRKDITEPIFSSTTALIDVNGETRTRPAKAGVGVVVLLSFGGGNLEVVVLLFGGGSVAGLGARLVV